MLRSLALLFFVALSGQSFAANDWVNMLPADPTGGLVTGRYCYSTNGKDISCDAGGPARIASDSMFIPTMGATLISATAATGTVTATNIYGLNVSGTNGTFGALTVNGIAITSNGSSGDRIVSGTGNSVGLIANSNTNIISITNAGVVGGYFNSNGVLTVPGISATSNLTSVTSLYASGKATVAGDLAVSTSVLYVSASSGNVGIGTTSPQAKLHVSGGSIYLDNNNPLRFAATNGTYYVGMNMTSSDVFQYGPSSGNYSLAFNPGNVEALRIVSTGNVGIGTTAPSAKLDVIGTISATAIQLKPYAVTCSTSISGTMRYNNVSNTMEYCTGSAWTSMGPSSTSPVAFNAYLGVSNQTVPTATWTKITLNNEMFDTNNNFDSTTNYRFTPTVPGKYLFNGNIYCSGSSYCYVSIYKNGAQLAQSGTSTNGTNLILPVVAIADMNGTTDYVELYVYTGDTLIAAGSSATYLHGVLLAPQGTGGGGATPAGSTNDVQYNNAGALAADTGNFTYASSVLKAPTVSGTNVNALNISGTTGTFGSIGSGLINATGISITTNQTSVTTLYASGNVGIGTSVVSFTNANPIGLAISSTSAVDLQLASGGSRWEFIAPVNGNIGLYDAVRNNYRLYIVSATGNMGISNTSPNAALDVNGTISASNVYVTGTTGTVSATYGYFKYISATFGGGGASTMAALTDVSETGVASGMLLRYNGSKWESVGASTALSTTTMVPNWPDAIACNVTSPNYGLLIFRPFLMPYVSDGKYYYTNPINGTNNNILFNSDGSYSSTTLTTIDCNTSISALYAASKAFNFIGSSLNSASTAANGVQWNNNGQLGADLNFTYNSTTAVVSTSTISSTYDYSKYVSATTGTFGSIGSGLIAATGISITTNQASFTTIYASGKVGIGVTAPTDVLHVYNNLAGGTGLTIENHSNANGAIARVLLTNDATNTAGMLFGSSGNASYGGANGFAVGTFTAGPLGLYTSNVPRLFISSTATLVGIGTSTPNATLDVAGTISATALTLNGVAITGSASGDRIVSGTGNSVAVVANSNTNIISITIGGVNTGYFNSNGVLTVPGISATSALTSVTTLYASGKVGIGTTAPGTKLVVSTNASALQPANPGTGNPNLAVVQFAAADSTNTRVLVDGYSGVPILDFRRSDGTAAAPSALQSAENLGQISWFGYGATGYSPSARANINVYATQNWTDTAQGTYMSFSTTPSGTVAGGERMRIDDAGNVGIGTSAPSTTLHVERPDAAGIYSVNTTALGSGSGGGVWGLVYVTPTAVNQRLGTIGFGALNPTLVASAVITGYASEAWTSSAHGTHLRFETVANGTTARAERMRITDSGNVGIGLVTPTTALEVNGTVSASTVSATYGYFKYISATSFQGATTTMVQNWPDAIYCSGSSGSSYLYHNSFTTGSVRTYNASQGSSYVNIQFNSDGSYNTNRSSGWGSTYYTSCVGTSISTLYANGAAFNFIGSNLTSAASPNNGLQYSNNGVLAGSGVTYISGTGNVGIGTASPASTAKLHILNGSSLGLTPNAQAALVVEGNSGNGNVNINLLHGAGHSSSLLFGDPSSSIAGQIYYDSSGAGVFGLTSNVASPMTFGTNSIERMRIDSSGNVGIGTTAPNATLDVIGTISGSTVSATNVNAKNISATTVSFADGTTQTTKAFTSCTNVSAAFGPASSATASCAAGYTLTGGGVQCANGNGASPGYNYPSGNSWIGGYCFFSPGSSNGAGTAYAVCCH